MLSTLDVSDAVQYVMLLIGIVLLLKRVAEMERYHTLRVVVLTSLLSSVVIYFFLVYGFTLGNPISSPGCYGF
jgi:dolichyl-phosphate-mannose--protein O-mannosyl transferase